MEVNSHWLTVRFLLPVILQLQQTFLHAAEMTFNGNDAVGLFKTECLSISLEPSMAERLICCRCNLKKKAAVTGPNTTFNISENGILIQQIHVTI
jgi:hypothetical protein